MQLTCNMVHCLDERALFSSSFVAVFWRSFPSNAPIMLYNIHYRWFFFSQGNDEQITWCIPKYRGQNLAFWCLHLGLLWTVIWLQSEVVDLCFIHCHIYTKTPFCCIETIANNALNHWHVVFDRLWANAVPTLNIAFTLTNVHAKWWIHCLLISSTPLLSYATSIYDQLKWVWSFLFSETTADFSII